MGHKMPWLFMKLYIYMYNMIQSLQTRYIFVHVYVEKNFKNVCLYTFYTTKDELM